MLYPIRFLLFSAAVFFFLTIHGLIQKHAPDFTFMFDALGFGGLATYVSWIYENTKA